MKDMKKYTHKEYHGIKSLCQKCDISKKCETPGAKRQKEDIYVTSCESFQRTKFVNCFKCTEIIFKYKQGSKDIFCRNFGKLSKKIFLGNTERDESRSFHTDCKKRKIKVPDEEDSEDGHRRYGRYTDNINGIIGGW